MLLIAGRHRIRICQPDRAPSTTAVAQSNLPLAVIDHVAASHLYSFQSFCCRVSVALILSLSWQMMIVFRKNEKRSSRFAKKAFLTSSPLRLTEGRPVSQLRKRFLSVSFLLDLACLGNWSFLIRNWRKQSPAPPGQRAQLDSQSTQTETGHDIIMSWFTQCVRIRIDR